MHRVSQLLALVVLVLGAPAQAEDLPVPDRVIDCSATVAKPFPLLYSKRLPITFDGTGLHFDESDRLHDIARSPNGSLLAAGFVGKKYEPSQKVLLVSIDPNGRVRERADRAPTNAMSNLRVAAYPDGRFIVLVEGAGHHFLAEIGPDLRAVWKPFPLPQRAIAQFLRPFPDGFVVEGVILGTPEAGFVGRYRRGGAGISWREWAVDEEPGRTLVRHALPQGDALAFRDSRSETSQGIILSRTGETQWSRRYICRDCVFLESTLDDDGARLTVTNDLIGGTLAGLDMLFFDVAVDGRASPAIGVRFPPHGYSFTDGRPVYSSPPIVGRRELASGRQVLVQRWLINSLASNLLEEQIYLLTLNEKPACRLLVDKSLPAGASNFITKASFSADGSILLFGWAFADRRWSDDRLIWIARLVQP
ncbi:MAG: hypothetical protein AB7O63_07965 [Reyranellaceae bacterium]